MSQTNDVTAQTVGDFVEKFLKGEIKPSVKSEPIPTSQPESAYVLVADEFDQVTADKSKDMFIECVSLGQVLSAYGINPLETFGSLCALVWTL